jgi:hypothetical protein
VVSERLTADAHRTDAATVRPLRSSKARQVHSSARAVCGEAEEFPLEQTTSAGKRDTPPPSSPHAGSNVRVQYASPIPRSDAHNMVAANGQVTRLPCGDGCRLAAVMADIWFGLDTGHDPGWRMKRSRPATADRDGPGAVRPARDAEHRATPQLAGIARSAGAIRCSRAGSPSPAGHARPRPNGACAAHWRQRLR